MAYQLPVEHDTRPAFRVAATIGTVKWIIVGLYGLMAVVALLGALFAGELNGVTLLAALGIGAFALVAWVMFGWAQHTLGMLAIIARNTSSLQH